ncbi:MULTISPECIES: hypothetical protein [Myroides]|uniref:Uncharacterized protein n=2 Tax=Myroides odoratimimus TaxID=76832 RepID=A0AAI8C5T2_9FLAO|nr:MULTISPECIES: hypothetical protein [Myroides]ALU26832.1 hypothetical protein AS202_12045 [Myroides odoratimimus]ALU27499.1 hypothetical protein AS202_15705 [Myroides odoratimimus]EHO06167.1 hypothetical protein HMPREF9712_03230 [Myroides odoratimimus CCUG 10230]MDM1036296.1 hypothetical protein [Myroides odoratimimus]MDM1362620.1 hypothetical protein [Myroides marinus]
MKEKITGIISLLGGIGSILLLLFTISKERIDDNLDFLIIILILITGISIVMYVIWTKFGKRGFSELDKLEYENQLLKKQIEQKELKQKLEE